MTSVTEDTTDLFIEVTGMDASVSKALNIMTTALAERGGKIESMEVISDNMRTITPDLSPTIKKIQVSEVNSLLGLNLTEKQISTALGKMRFGTRILSHGDIEVAVPAYRVDILHAWDIIEDVAIGYGYDRFKPAFPETPSIGKSHPIEDKLAVIREIMVGLGFLEVMTFTLTNEHVHFDMMRRKRKDVTRVKHPVSEAHTIVRSTILPNLLEILSLNRHRGLPQRIFSPGDVILDAKTTQRLAGVSIHAAANFAEIKSVVEAGLRELGIKYKLTKSSDPAFLEGRRASITVGHKRIGVFGEIHPDVITNFQLDHPIVAFELELI
jgi:phenylalanyl-tRNA synthetase beta chain